MMMMAMMRWWRQQVSGREKRAKRKKQVDVKVKVNGGIGMDQIECNNEHSIVSRLWLAFSSVVSAAPSETTYKLVGHSSDKQNEMRRRSREKAHHLLVVVVVFLCLLL